MVGPHCPPPASHAQKPKCTATLAGSCSGGPADLKISHSITADPKRSSATTRSISRACIFACYSVPRRNIFLLISVAYHRRYGRAVWIDPVVLRAITISWNNIIIPVRSCPYHGHPDDNPLPWFTNDFGLPRMRCGTERPQVNSTRAVPRATVIILMPRPHCDRGKLTSTCS